MQQPMHQHISIDGLNLFYREAGPAGAPTVLLLHGSPSSSIAFRYMLAELSDRWHLIAPDLPAFGFTQVPGNLRYCFTFDNLARTVARFIEQLRLKISAVYLHDYGAQVDFRLLTSETIHPKVLVIQNSEAYQDIGWRAPMKAVEKRLSDPPEVFRAKIWSGFAARTIIRESAASACLLRGRVRHALRSL